MRYFGKLVLLIWGAVLVSCGTQPVATPEPTPTPLPVTLGLLLPETQNPFFISIHEGAEEAAARLGVRLMVEVSDNDIETQMAQGRRLLARPVSALVIIPVDSAGIVPLVQAANEAAIPVFTIDRNASRGQVVSHIASDNLAGGDIAGDFLARAISGRGRVVELQGPPGTSAAQERTQGFRQALADFPDVEVIASEPGYFEKQQARSVFGRLLSEHPVIDAVFAHNDAMALGAMEAAIAVGRDDEIIFVGFDAIPEAVEAIEAGALRATVAQQPKEMGRLGVELAVAYLRDGLEPPAMTSVDLALVTR